jgi:hypothetical protein
MLPLRSLSASRGAVCSTPHYRVSDPHKLSLAPALFERLRYWPKEPGQSGSPSRRSTGFHASSAARQALRSSRCGARQGGRAGRVGDSSGNGPGHSGCPRFGDVGRTGGGVRGKGPPTGWRGRAKGHIQPRGEGALAHRAASAANQSLLFVFLKLDRPPFGPLEPGRTRRAVR